jgi:hypothetical protein
VVGCCCVGVCRSGCLVSCAAAEGDRNSSVSDVVGHGYHVDRDLTGFVVMAVRDGEKKGRCISDIPEEEAT